MGSALIALLLLAPTAEARQTRDTLGLARVAGTRAGRYLARGAIGGVVVGGLLGSVFSEGLCDRANCSDAAMEGLVAGAMAGLVTGGVTGLVIGSGVRTRSFSADDERGPWGWTVSAGPGWAGSGSIEGWRIVAGVSAQRPTVARVSFGVEGRYLGSSAERTEVRIAVPGGEMWGQLRTVRQVIGLGLVSRLSPMRSTTRLVLLADSGVYLLRESTVVRQNPTSPDVEGDKVVDVRSLSPLPGVGLGAIWERGPLEVALRSHGILGAGDHGVLPVVELSVGATFD